MVNQIRYRAQLDTCLKEADDKLVIIDFFATWCGPCKRIAPVLAEIAENKKAVLVVLKVDVDEADELAAEYNISVMPTFVFIRKGEHIDTLSGSNEAKLNELIEKHLTTK